MREATELIPEVSELCEISEYPPQAVAAAFISFPPKLGPKVARDIPGDYLHVKHILLCALVYL